MSLNHSYQVLHNQEDILDHSMDNTTVSSSPEEVGPQSPAVASIENLGVSPPPYIAEGETVSVAEHVNEPPPLYTDVVKLPSYNESESMDQNDNEAELEGNHRPLFFWINNDPLYRRDESCYEVGSDTSFMFSFLLALVFNWIGFLVSYCFTRSLASYYGAISGFGISLVKWAFIAQHSEWSRDFMVENPWFCYAFVLFGWVIFMRGIFSYIQMKRLSNHNYASEENSCGIFN